MPIITETSLDVVFNRDDTWVVRVAVDFHLRLGAGVLTSRHRGRLARLFDAAL